jgi:hypothetical protein
MGFIKKHWWFFILAIILCPIFVNIILSISTCFKVYENGWLGFWGSFLGALFTFLALYITLNDNHSENEKERKAHAGTIEYQVSRECLNDLKQSMAAYYKTMSIYEMEMIALNPKEDVQYSLKVLWKIIRETENSYQLLRLALVDYDDVKETEYKTFLNKFNTAYHGLLSDFAWLIDGKKSLDEYKDDCKRGGNISIENLRIWKVIEDGNYNRETDGCFILNKLLERVEYRAFLMKSENFVAYENEKMKKSLDDALNLQL